jgi:hypothetical protein
MVKVITYAKNVNIHALNAHLAQIYVQNAHLIMRNPMRTLRA